MMELSAHLRRPVGTSQPRVWISRCLATRQPALTQGFTLIEVLVGCALVAILGLAISGILSILIGSERFYLAQTDRYESLRLPATLIVQDARYANSFGCSADLRSLVIWLDPSWTDNIEYRLEKDGVSAASPWKLKRTVTVGGVTNFDYIAYDLVVASSTKSKFACNVAFPDQTVVFTLFKRPPSTGGQELRYQGTALLR